MSSPSSSLPSPSIKHSAGLSRAQHWLDNLAVNLPKLLAKAANLDSLAEALMDSALKQMPAGQLTLTNPDGRTKTYGGELSIQPVITAGITIIDNRFYSHCLLNGHIGFGEAYINGWWEPSEGSDISDVLSWFLVNVEHCTMLEGTSAGKQFWFNALGWINQLIHTLRPNSLHQSSANIQAHYDLSNDFFKLFLDDSLTYSSGIFPTAETTLEDAQRLKIDNLLSNLRLESHHHLLEIGTGWGALAIRAAQTTGCKVTTITISKAQYEVAKERIEQAGLSDRINLQLLDYRKLPKAFKPNSFDRIVSVEMVEALGDKYMESFYNTCHTMLKRDGLLALQMITCPDSRYDILKNNTDFIQKHIFPGSLLPSIGRMNDAMNNTGDLSLFSLQDMGLSYAKTLRHWLNRFNEKTNELDAMGFDNTFRRKWRYYLQYCEAAFAMRNISVVQALYTRPNNPNLMVPAMAAVAS